MGDTLRERIGRSFAAQRKSLQLTQREVGLRAGVSPKYLSAIERGATNPTVDLLERLARVLDWTPDTPFSRESLEELKRELVARTSDIKDRVAVLERRLGALGPASPTPTDLSIASTEE